MRVPTLPESRSSAVAATKAAFHGAIEACTRPPEPRWPAMFAILAVGGLHMALPPSLTAHYHLGPSWLIFAIVGILLIPTVVTFKLGHDGLNHIFGLISLGVITLVETLSLIALVRSLPVHTVQPGQLLRSSLALWIVNVLVFALWYWRLDAGGPNERDDRHFHESGAFLFPQMTLDDDKKAELGMTLWRPQFLDYLFLAFNHSTAFSPTDTAILSRWAKMLVMIQASVSVAVVTLLAARAVNIL